MSALLDQARRLFSLLDITALDERLNRQQLCQLCLESSGPLGEAAALCVPPRFVPYARHYLEQAGVAGMPIATISNFPDGFDNLRIAYAETRAAVAYGADEIDLVFPYRALQEGDLDSGLALVQGCRAICGDQVILKVILETGALKTPKLIRVASELAIAGGADFIKTSTGTTDVGATLEAACIILEVIREADGLVGFKASGGIASLEAAAAYVKLAEEIMGPDWVRPANFRIGSTRLHKTLLHAAEMLEAQVDLPQS